MNYLKKSILGLVSMVAVATGCGAALSAPSAAQQADIIAYAAQEQACVQAAKANDAGLAGANACIAGVQAYWCGDGGALAGYCANQVAPASDAGGQ